MKRLTINQIEKFIQTLESTERVNGYSEQQKQHAIACLNNYCRELEYQVLFGKLNAAVSIRLKRVFQST